MIKINIKNVNKVDLLDKSGYYIFCLKKDKNLPETGDNIIFSKFKSLNVVYVGITDDSLASRVLKKHIYGNGGNSTLRKSIGSMLGLTKVPRSGAEKIKRDKGKSFKTKFNDDGESIVSEWIESNLIIFFDYDENPLNIEDKLIQDYNPPLNIDKNNNIINYNFRRKLSHPNRKLTSLRSVKKNLSKPFVKWAGGKYKLADKLIPFFPSEFDDKKNTYYEPMVGSGGFFFKFNPRNAYLSDINKKLVITYNVIKNDITGLIDQLKIHEELHDKDYFYKSRIKFNELIKSYKNELEISSLFIYLNKTCFNGLYRENSKGEFNVPLGSYNNPLICDEKTLFMLNNVLKNVQINCHGYKESLEKITKGDFIYLDPPYIPLKKDSFTKYSKKDWKEEQSRELNQYCKSLDEKGAFFMLSNSDTNLTRDIFNDKNRNFYPIEAPRFISAKGNSREKANEVIITNY